jgi:hypothetical protein
MRSQEIVISLMLKRLYIFRASTRIYIVNAHLIVISISGRMI